MKKFITLSFLSLAFTGMVMAQTPVRNHHKLLPVKNQTGSKVIPLKKPAGADEVQTKSNSQGNENSKTSSVQSTVESIGSTTYDLQTNRSNRNSIYNLNNRVSAIWTHSQDLVGTFPDRGTGYNTRTGGAWNGVELIDTLAWSNIDLGPNNTEYLLGHTRPVVFDDLFLLSRTTPGSGPWTKTALPLHPGGHFCIWARMRVGGANGMTIHVIALTRPVANSGMLNNGIDGSMTYSRSQDGGVTWDIVHELLPMIDSTHYLDMSADSYQIDVRGSTVAIVQGGYYNDWVLWKSTDNGDSWTRTVVWAFPIPAYDVNNMSTDINGDAVADTIDFIDGSMAVLIDNNNMVHCWSGHMRVLQELLGGMGIFSDVDGLYYWKESMGSQPPGILTSALDLDNDGQITIAGNGSTGYSLTSMPSAGIDGSSNIFLVYSSIKENTTSGTITPASYRNTHVMVSPDNGANWTVPVNIDDSNFDDLVFPCIARNVGPDIHIIYQADGEPGTAVNGQGGVPYGLNEIRYFTGDADSIFENLVLEPFSFGSIEGTVYFDANQNGVQDIPENVISNFPVTLQPNNDYAATNSAGLYTYYVHAGIYTVQTGANSNWMITSDSLTYTVSVDSVVIDSLDFGLYPANSVYHITSTLTPGLPRCNSSMQFWIQYVNTGTETTDGTVRFIKDPQITYQNAMPPYTSFNGDTLEWTFSNLVPFEHRQIHLIMGTMGLNVGDIINNCEQVLYNNGSTGGYSEDCMMQPILCSYDPNDKAVKPEGVGGPQYVLLNDTLIYTIRFQNVGNDTAFTVRIRDTLSAFLDPTSFHIMASSHPLQYTLQSNGALLITFSDIQLPDSATNELGSNGFVKYSVRPIQGLPVGTVVTNTAHIFFDYNEAVVTNTTSNTLVDVIGMAEHLSNDFDITVIPNPFSNHAIIHFSKELQTNHLLNIYDLSGRKVIQINNVHGNSIELDSPELTHGMYFCTVSDESGTIIGVEKLVVR